MLEWERETHFRADEAGNWVLQLIYTYIYIQSFCIICIIVYTIYIHLHHRVGTLSFTCSSSARDWLDSGAAGFISLVGKLHVAAYLIQFDGVYMRAMFAQPCTHTHSSSFSLFLALRRCVYIALWRNIVYFFHSSLSSFFYTYHPFDLFERTRVNSQTNIYTSK